MIRNAFILDDFQRVGFIAGLVWQRNSVLDFKKFMQYWYGPVKHGSQVFRILHQQIEITREFSQHKCLQIYFLVCNIIAFLFALLLFFKFMSFLNDETDFIQVLVVAFILYLAYKFRQSSEIIFLFVGCRLKSKIIKAIELSNINLNKLGYKANFPTHRIKIFYCIPLCIETNMTRIEIFDLNSNRHKNRDLFALTEMVKPQIIQAQL